MISYTVRSRKGARGVRISINSVGDVLILKPKFVTQSQVEQLLKEKEAWIFEKIEEQKKKPKKLLAHYGVKDFKERKVEARKLAESRVEHFNKFYGFSVKSIKVRNQKTRWGSCSRSGNLSFNYKIIFLPQELADYIIVHELCHLAQMNHGKAFWDLVSKQIPDHKIRRKNIKLY